MAQVADREITVSLTVITEVREGGLEEVLWLLQLWVL